jgi:RHS repeat-associated protein
VFDEGIDPLLEFKSGSASDLSHRYLWGPAVDQLFADEQPTSTGSAGNVLWALGDNLGSIRDIADLSGSTTSVTNHRRFGAYGNLVSESNSVVDLLFGFTGKLYDENVKLQNNLNRWYDAAIGQWVSQDPKGFDAGDENLRRYVGNGAVEKSDPTGLEEPSAVSDPFAITGNPVTDIQAVGNWLYAWEVGGTVGVAQGVLNTANGLTDQAISTVGNVVTPLNPVLNSVGIDLYSPLKVDWSEGRVMPESGDGWWDDTHGWSKWGGVYWRFNARWSRMVTLVGLNRRRAVCGRMGQGRPAEEHPFYLRIRATRFELWKRPVISVGSWPRLWETGDNVMG